MTDALRSRPGPLPAPRSAEHPAVLRPGRAGPDGSEQPRKTTPPTGGGPVAVAAPGRGASRNGVTKAHAPAKPIVARSAVEARRPYHVGVVLGLSAGVYAVSLAGVTALQSSSEQAIAAAQAPTVATLQAVTAGHDDLERRLAESGSAYEAVAADYQRAGNALGALESQLGSLATAVGKVTGVTSALPDRVALPSLPRVPVAAAAPAVHATTTASGQPLP